MTGGRLTLNWDLGSWRLTSTTGYYEGDYVHRADADGTPQQLLETEYLGAVTQWSQEWRISDTSTGPLHYTAGVYLSDETHNVTTFLDMFHGLEPLIPVFGADSGFTLAQDYKQDRDSQAVFARFEYELSDRTRMTLGMRYTRDENKQYNFNSFQGDYDRTPMVGLLPFNVPYDPQAVYPAQSFNDNEVTGTVGIDHDITDNTMVYASYSRGYRSGAFNGAAYLAETELQPVDPEYVNTYEVGAKGRAWDDKLEYRAAAFYNDYRNQQFLKIVGIQQLMDSADRAETQGMELEVDALLSSAWRLTAGLSWLDSEYTEGLALTAGGVEYDLTGNQLIGAPELTANIAIDYTQPIATGELSIHLDGQYMAERWFSAFNDVAGFERIGQAGYSTWNVRSDYTWQDDRYRVGFWVRNLTDKVYKTYAINLSDSFGFHYTVQGLPRTYGAELEVRF